MICVESHHKGNTELYSFFVADVGNLFCFGDRETHWLFKKDVFELNGVPAFSIAHRTNPGGSEIHTRNDSHAVLSEDSMLRDIETISALADRMANAAILPVARTIPQNVQEKLDYYFFRKRETPKE